MIFHCHVWLPEGFLVPWINIPPGIFRISGRSAWIYWMWPNLWTDLGVSKVNQISEELECLVEIGRSRESGKDELCCVRSLTSQTSSKTRDTSSFNNEQHLIMIWWATNLHHSEMVSCMEHKGSLMFIDFVGAPWGPTVPNLSSRWYLPRLKCPWLGKRSWRWVRRKCLEPMWSLEGAQISTNSAGVPHPASLNLFQPPNSNPKLLHELQVVGLPSLMWGSNMLKDSQTFSNAWAISPYQPIISHSQPQKLDDLAHLELAREVAHFERDPSSCAGEQRNGRKSHQGDAGPQALYSLSWNGSWKANSLLTLLYYIFFILFRHSKSLKWLLCDDFRQMFFLNPHLEYMTPYISSVSQLAVVVGCVPGGTGGYCCTFGRISALPRVGTTCYWNANSGFIRILFHKNGSFGWTKIDLHKNNNSIQ